MPDFFGLFLIGAILCYAFERTGSLYLSIGLHGGWIFALKTIRVFGDYTRKDLGGLFGSSYPKIVSVPATWVGIALVALAVYRITQARRKWLSSDETASVCIVFVFGRAVERNIDEKMDDTHWHSASDRTVRVAMDNGRA